MTVYAIAQLTITDRERYDVYQAHFFDVFQKYNGTLLASDEAPSVMEGQWNKDKVVLMSFPDEQSIRDRTTSTEKQKKSK
jgi:uncharacterized protein (DUF1330 family)